MTRNPVTTGQDDPEPLRYDPGTRSPVVDMIRNLVTSKSSFRQFSFPPFVRSVRPSRISLSGFCHLFFDDNAPEGLCPLHRLVSTSTNRRLLGVIDC